MFITKDRTLAIPQDEHARLAGAIAAHWGNSEFALPHVDRDEFIAGVRCHDSMHGLFDTFTVLDRPERGSLDDAGRAALIAIYEGGLTFTSRPVVDALRMLHIMVLAKGLSTEVVRSADLLIDRLVRENGLYRPELDKTYNLLRACDSVAFDFSFRDPAPRTGVREVYRGHGDATPTLIHFEVRDACIILDPWPLNRETVTGEIMAYDLKGYPFDLKAVPVNYTVLPK